MNSKSILRAAAFTAVLTLVGAGQAVAQSATFQVSATVSRSCSINAASLDFGTYNPLQSTDTDASGRIDIRCTRGTTAYIALDAGQVGGRRMDGGTGTNLSYALFKDASRAETWGATGGDRYLYNATNSGLTGITVHGRVTALQDAPAGTYTDTVTATIEF